MADSAFKKQLWISFAVIAGSVVLAGVALFLLADHIGALTKKITTARQVTADESAAYGMLANLKTNAAAATGYQAAIDKLLPSQDGAIAFSGQVNQLATQDGITASFSFQGDATPAVPPAPGSIGFTLNIGGPFNKLVAFLKDLERNAPVILSTIDTFDLHGGGGAEYSIAAQGKVFFR